MWPFKKDKVDELIDRHISALMQMDESSEDYVAGLDALSRLLEAKAKAKAEKRLDPNVVLTAGMSVLTTLIVLASEEDGMVVKHRAAWNSRMTKPFSRV